MVVVYVRLLSDLKAAAPKTAGRIYALILPHAGGACDEVERRAYEQLSALFAVRGGGGEATSEDYDQGRTAQCRIIYTCHPATVSHYRSFTRSAPHSST